MKNGWWQDLRISLRVAASDPGTTALAVVAFGLGIGLSTAALSVVQGVILRGLPFEDAGRIQSLSLASPESPRRGLPVPVHDFLEWRQQQQAFESLEGYVERSVTVIGLAGYPERLSAARITPGTLRTLRTTPLLGRDFGAPDAAPGAEAVMIISYDLWQSRLSPGDPIGRTVNVDGVPTVIVGVMPPSFAFPLSQQGWLPLSLSPSLRPGMGGRLNVFGRLNEGRDRADASREMSLIAARVSQPTVGAMNVPVRVLPFQEQALGDDVVAALFTMLGAVIGVLLVSCVNVASLLLMRAAEREREFAVRIALGAGAWPIVRRTTADALALAAGGALAGLGFAVAATSVFGRSIAGTNPPFWIDVRPDLTVIASAIGVTALAAVLASLAPAWRLTRLDINRVLNDGGYATTNLRAGRWFRVLVIGEVAVTCLLLVIAGVMMRGVLRSDERPHPATAEGVFYGSVTLEDRPSQPLGDVAATNRLVELRLSQVPGARMVALASGVLHVARTSSPIDIEGRPTEPAATYPRGHQITVSDRYFDVLHVQLLSGRLFNTTDTQSGRAVAVVDEGFAGRYLPDGAVGRRIRFGVEMSGKVIFPVSSWITVVGVVGGGMAQRADDIGTVYRPLSQTPLRSFAVLIATPREPSSLGPDVRKAVAGLAGGTAIGHINSLSGHLWQQAWPARTFGSVFALFGATALLLASVGLYGVVAFDVRQRTKEMGIRMALGADRRRILRLVLRQSLWRVSAGIMIGLIPAWWIGRWAVSALPELLVGVSPDDQVVYVMTVSVLLISGAAASLGPAYRAASKDVCRTVSGRF